MVAEPPRPTSTVSIFRCRSIRCQLNRTSSKLMGALPPTVELVGPTFIILKYCAQAYPGETITTPSRVYVPMANFRLDVESF